LLTVTKQPNTSTIDLTDQLEKSLSELQHTMPADIIVSTDIFRQARFIENSISNVQKALYEGGLFLAIVLFIFLMNYKTTLISLVSIPLSLVTSTLTLKAFGLTINTMSLGGMAIAIGPLVDDAIIDVENVFKRLRENRLKPKEEQEGTLRVVYEASREVRMPILNSTFIIVASFIPLFFLSGMEGRMLTPLGITVIVSLFASTFVALTLTPVLCSYLLANPKNEEKANKEPRLLLWLKRNYEKALSWCLKYKLGILISTGLVLIVTVWVFFGLGRSFLPPFNEGSLTVNVSTLPGVSLDESDRIGQRAEEILLSFPEVITTGRKTGRAELDEHVLGVNDSEIEAPFRLQDRSQEEFFEELRERL